MAALSVPGLAQTLLDRQLRGLGPEALVQRALALVCAEPSRVDGAVVDAHVNIPREREHLGAQNARAFIQASRWIRVPMADPRLWAGAAPVKAPTLDRH